MTPYRKTPAHERINRRERAFACSQITLGAVRHERALGAAACSIFALVAALAMAMSGLGL